MNLTGLWRLFFLAFIIFGGMFAFVGLFYSLYGPREKGAKKAAAIMFAVSLASFTLIFYLSYRLDIVAHDTIYAILKPISYFGLGWTAMTYLLIVPFAILLFVKWLVNRRAKKVSPKLAQSRRELFKKAAIGIPLVTFAGGSALVISSQKDLFIKEMTISYPQLPDYMKTLRIGQISDLHLGPYASFKTLNYIFETFAKKGVTRVMITGDLIDDIPMLPQLCKILNTWAPQFSEGIDYIYGNHEYYRDFDLIEESFKDVNMRIFTNENIPLTKEGDSWPVYLVGVDYPFGRGQTEYRIESFMDVAMEGVPENAFVILMAHHPDFIGAAFDRNIPFTLAGHSHGGQLNVFHKSIVPMDFHYWRGFYKAEEKDLYGYVSTGAGDWFPMRLNCPREVTIFDFKEGSNCNEYNQYV